MEIQDSITFNGIEYRLMGSGKYYLSQSKDYKGRKNPKGLHVAIWEFHNKKEVPNGFCVHHKDHDVFNFDIDNLECISIKQHLSYHAKKNYENEIYVSKNKAHLESIRHKASEWHKSKEGREWHKEMAKSRVLEKKQLTCKNCGNTFLSVYSDSLFCSESCGCKFRHKKSKIKYAGKCIECGKEFESEKTKKQQERKTCSKSCANKLNHKNRRCL